MTGMPVAGCAPSGCPTCGSNLNDPYCRNPFHRPIAERPGYTAGTRADPPRRDRAAGDITPPGED